MDRSVNGQRKGGAEEGRRFNPVSKNPRLVRRKSERNIVEPEPSGIHHIIHMAGQCERPRIRFHFLGMNVVNRSIGTVHDIELDSTAFNRLFQIQLVSLKMASPGT